MKLDALDHPKTLDFASRLDVSRPTAIGHLELFWHFVAKHAPRGNIGKFSDGAIARASDWIGDPETFLKSLLKSGFIDHSDAHRYLVHDWPEHCPNWVRAQILKLKTPFFRSEVPTEVPTEDDSYERSSVPSTRARVSKPSQGIPSQAKPSENGEGRERKERLCPDPGIDRREFFVEVQRRYPLSLTRGDHWMLAEKSVNGLLDDGVSATEILAAVDAYREQQQALGKVGSESVKRASNFFGSAAWRGPFPLPVSKAQTTLESNIAAGQEFLRGSGT